MNPDDMLLDPDAIDWLDPEDAPLRSESALADWLDEVDG